MQTDELIIKGCKKNNRKAQKQLYDKYSEMLLGFCVRYATDIAEAEDILQEGFLKIFKHVHEYSGKGQFKNWLIKIMINTAITHYHKNKKHQQHSELEEYHEELQVDETPDTELSAQDLLKLIKRLPEGYKMVFNLYAIEGYKHKEIAERLNIDESTSKSQYLRAKKWLMNEIKKQEPITHDK